MNDSSPGILVLGGGVAGMSAALALKHQDLSIHLVETQNHLGGNASAWACMATDTCQNCGACLALEMVEQVKQADNISIHLNTHITELNRTDNGMDALLANGETIAASRAVMATGFTPFDPAGLPSLHSLEHKKVITTAELNTLIQQGRLEEMAGPSPSIAFLQCVGSRNREQNRDYCSQVCCKISMRHARKILHLMPDADISLFYMDLQIIGKEARSMADQLSSNVRLIQGVPAEILENKTTGKLSMVTEAPGTRTRVTSEFDMVVLSVGMVPDHQTTKLSTTLGASPNTWGFFNTTDAEPGNDIVIAGCAKGPKDILNSIQDGRIAAASTLKSLGLAAPPETSIAVLGDGDQAKAVTHALSDRGYGDTVKNLSPAGLISIGGTAGNFSIYYREGETKKVLSCSAVIAAPDAASQSHTNEFKGAVSLTDYVNQSVQDRPDKALILLDYFGPESKDRARKALTAAVDARSMGKEVDILMNKILVHGPEGQKLFDQARKTGVGFLRYETPSDIKIESLDKGFKVTLKEATLPGLELTLDPLVLVVPDTLTPAPGFDDFAQLLGTGLDREGFLQPANTRHRLVRSMRKGIFFTGSCHDDIDADDMALEIEAILADLETKPQSQAAPAETAVVINEKKCAKCLTCYRVCPHNAITLNAKQRPEINQDACFSCQSCVSNCPAYAIESQGQSNEDFAARSTKGKTLVFACERSGVLAARDLPDTTELVSLPCACRISPDMILNALVQGTDRVIVSSCHEGNCRSGDGSTIARQGVAAVSTLPGLPDNKVLWQPVAANEPHIFSRLVSKA
ncbi:MAG: FAD-dependent oxidoreductase [Desulfobacterales bacterium]|nr:FAD-dependent oxidoreductase [Desulfobacterales bacterium]